MDIILALNAPLIAQSTSSSQVDTPPEVKALDRSEFKFEYSWAVDCVPYISTSVYNPNEGKLRNKILKLRG